MVTGNVSTIAACRDHCAATVLARGNSETHGQGGPWPSLATALAARDVSKSTARVGIDVTPASSRYVRPPPLPELYALKVTCCESAQRYRRRDDQPHLTLSPRFCGALAMLSVGEGRRQARWCVEREMRKSGKREVGPAGRTLRNIARDGR